MNAAFLKGLVPMVSLRLNELFEGDSGTRFATFNHTKAKLIAAINAKQTAKSMEVTVGGVCAGFKVVWPANCAPIGTSVCETAPSGCDLTATATATVDDKTYNPTCNLSEPFMVNDNVCNNLVTAEEMVSLQLADAIKRLDIRLNRKAYIQLGLNATPNLHPNPIGTVSGTVTEIPASLWNSELLLQLTQEIEFTGLRNPVMLDGMNLSFQRALAQFQKFNTTQVSGAKIFDAYDPMLIFDDPTDAFAANARQSTFAVDMDAVMMLTKVPEYGDTPIEIDGSRNLFHWTVTSPMTGVRYLVEYQKTCAGRKDGDLTIATDHKFVVRWLGDIVFAPNQCGNVGAVMEFVKVP